MNDIDELIGKHLAGESTAQENAMLQSWLQEKEANAKYFEQFQLIFERAAKVSDVHSFDTDAAWSKMKARLNQNSEAKTIVLKPTSNQNLFWRIAASIVLIVGIGFFTYRWSQPGTSETLEVIANSKSASDTLPDGSGVYLNKETKLAYTFDQKKKAHKVSLKGEAYFNIQHENEKTFIVSVDETFIKDIGTSFNVKGYPEENTIEVVVEEGEVMFYTEKDSGVYLRAGGKGVYHKDTKKFTVEQAEPNVTAYKTKFFIFSDVDLGYAVETVNNVYDKRIVISEKLKSCRLTVSFNNESLEEIANVMAETLGLTIKETSDAIILEGKGCE
jgi:transmembrane sensor